jgi:hypothetical protein
LQQSHSPGISQCWLEKHLDQSHESEGVGTKVVFGCWMLELSARSVEELLERQSVPPRLMQLRMTGWGGLYDFYTGQSQGLRELNV